MINQQLKNRLIILIIFAMGVIPIFIAWGLSKNTGLVKGGVNKGQLISPVVTTEPSDYLGFDAFSAQNIGELKGHWLIVNVMPQESCGQVCLESLLKTKQLRLMLNKELSRTRRVVLLFKDVQETFAQQYWLKDALLWRLRQNQNKADEDLYKDLLNPQRPLDDALASKLIGQENPKMALSSDLLRIKPGTELVKKLTAIRKGGIPEGMLFLIDPLGNIMMQYDPGFDPYQVKSDLMHLLKISQIG